MIMPLVVQGIIRRNRADFVDSSLMGFGAS
jgi:hypothetical protein